jgi:pimeloyl-ACP methyl ester carboxylesterase
MLDRLRAGNPGFEGAIMIDSQRIFLHARSQAMLRLAAALLLALAAGLHAAAATNPASRPILLVHGFCGTAEDFSVLLPPLYAKLNHTLYPSPTLYYVKFNVRNDTIEFFILKNGVPTVVEESAIPSDTRFFSMVFYDPISESSNTTDIAKISILNKGYEIARAIKQITAITHIQKVLVVAHSMGGLDVRAYMEDLASEGACYDYQANTPNYSLATCTPGAGDAKYAGDVGDLVTVDTPHAGAPLGALSIPGEATYLGTCLADPSVNRTEMLPLKLGGPGLFEALNYDGDKIGDAKPAANTVPIQAVENYFSDVTKPWDDVDNLLPGLSDDIVQLTSQSIVKNLPAVQSAAKLVDAPVSYLSSDAGIAATTACWVNVPIVGKEPVLHFMGCIGAQPTAQTAIAKEVIANAAGALTAVHVAATLDGVPWTGAVAYKLTGPDTADAETKVPETVTDLALGTYAVTFTSGGPKAVRPPAITAAPSGTLKSGQWSATFTLGFSSKNPAAATNAATAITADGADLKGTVNPEGQPGQAFLEWGTNPSLPTPKIACTGGLLKNCPVVKADYAAQAFSSTVTTAAKNTKIYFRMAFYDSASKTYVYGPTLNFTTAN